MHHAWDQVQTGIFMHFECNGSIFAKVTFWHFVASLEMGLVPLYLQTVHLKGVVHTAK